MDFEKCNVHLFVQIRKDPMQMVCKNECRPIVALFDIFLWGFFLLKFPWYCLMPKTSNGSLSQSV